MATPIDNAKAWHAFLNSNPGLQQFGQGDGDTTTKNGSLGCTHTVLQTLVQAKTGDRPTQDEISHAAGYPSQAGLPAGQGRGMTWSGGDNGEIMRVVHRYGLPYRLFFPGGPLTAAVWQTVKDAVSKGPAMIAVCYKYQPEKLNYTYRGVHSDGKPNGYALVGGKTQLTGFDGAHAELWVDYFKHTQLGWIHHVKDPNHGSGIRPEKPGYDRIRDAQMKRLVGSYRLMGRKLAFLLPTTTFLPRN